MFRWLRERRQRREKEVRQRREQLRSRAQLTGAKSAQKPASHYSAGAPASQPDSVAELFAIQLIAQEMASDTASHDAGRHHTTVTQSHHGSGDNIGGSVRYSNHSTHDYGSSHSSHSSHDSGSSYDSGSSSSGGDF